MSISQFSRPLSVFIGSFLAFGFTYNAAFPEFEIGKTKLAIDTHMSHMAALGPSRQMMGEHIIMLMDVYNTSNSISNRNMQAMGEVSEEANSKSNFKFS